ncbi:TerD family protein [Rhodococcus erythropolis]|nr:TerD family protein [Rhodococcus erythropolis]
MATLARGENTTLPHQRITVTASGFNAGTVDLLVFQLGMNEKVRSDEDLIFFNSPISFEGAVALSGDRVDINLQQVPAVVQFLRVAVSLDDSVTGSLATIAGLGVTLTDPSGTHIVATASGLSTERAAVLLEIYRRNGAWKARNISAGWDTGLAALVTEHGVTVDEAPAETVPVPVNTKKNTSGSAQSRPLGTVPRIHSAVPAEAAVLTVYPVKKEFIVNRGDAESRYNVPEGFEILHLDLEQMFDVALTNTGIEAENTWWELGFDPADEINEYTARRMTFTVRPGHTRPSHGIRMVFEEDGMTTEHGHRPDLDWPEWRGGVGTGPCELKELIFHIGLAVKNAVKDGYQFDGPWMFRIIDDPEDGKCLESFCKATWTKPKRWHVAPS